MQTIMANIKKRKKLKRLQAQLYASLEDFCMVPTIFHTPHSKKDLFM